jgi:hypothetical protein
MTDKGRITPRVDKLLSVVGGTAGLENLARTLERELAAITAERDALLKRQESVTVASIFAISCSDCGADLSNWPTSAAAHKCSPAALAAQEKKL